MKKVFLFLITFVLVSFFLLSCSTVPGGNGNSSSSSGGSSSSLAPGVYVTTNGNDTNSGTSPASSMLTIQYAISNAAANGLLFVYVAEGYYTTNTGLLPFISNNITNRGIWITNHNLQIIGGYSQDFASRTSNHFSFLDGLTVIPRGFITTNATNIRIDGFYLTRFDAFQDKVLSFTTCPGGGIYFENVKASTITNTIISNVSAWNGTVALNNSHFNQISGVFLQNNLGGGYGGGTCLFNDSSNNTINAVILNNSASGGGGGIYISGPNNTIMGLIVSNTSDYGGGIYLNGGNRNLITNAWIACNYGGQGGGAYINGSYNTIAGTMISNNMANRYGGGLYYSGNDNTNRAVVIGSMLTNNGTAEGAGIYLNGNNNLVTGPVSYNSTPSGTGLGGGIIVYGQDNIINATLSYNYGSWGGALCIGNTGNLISGTIINNTAGQGAAGIYILTGADNCSILNVILTNNYNTNSRGVITLDQPAGLLISNCLFSAGNLADTAIWEEVNCGGHTLINNTFITNRMAYVYRDINFGYFAPSDFSWINDIQKTDASVASGNTAIVQ